MDKITLGGNVFTAINYAMQQNYVPIIRNLILVNKTEEVLQNLLLKISFEPGFARVYEQKIESLLPEQPLEIAPVRIILSPDYLLSVTEKIAGNIHIEVLQQEEALFTQDFEITLYAYDEWTGTFLMPEILSAFVTPNHPDIQKVISRASSYLNKWNGSPSFTGYQTENPNVVKSQLAAIYAALQEENIAYTMPPASYETAGQRIRLPNVVLEQKMGTCIELSTLYASCLEAVGLHPILIIIRGHAFCGCWLDDQCFSESVQDDVAALQKRTAEGIDELCLVESTCFVAGEVISFDNAVRRGNDHLLHPENFLMSVDIARSRYAGIRPIPMRIVSDGHFQAVDYGSRREEEITHSPDEIDLTQRYKQQQSTEAIITKQKLWERKLLDLSLRNTLLSFKVSKNAIQLMAGNLSTLEDALADGESFQILPRPTDWENTLRDSKIFEVENQRNAIEQLVLSEFKSKRVRSFLDESELRFAVKELHRRAKLSLEENGSNTLYLALGYLRWFESDLSERARYAPIVLIPVEILRKAQGREFTLRIRDEEPQMNITLLEKLKQDFGISVSGLDPLPTDQSGIDLKLVFNIIRHAVMNKKRWDVEEFAFLGLFSFNQFIMWNDLRNRSDDIEKNKIVKSLISGKMEWQSGVSLELCQLDDLYMPDQIALPMSTDSSQLAAICTAAAGESFVLHGPPGTGKSQTITNMIANAMYQGKSVLFVAEKMAALTVVQRRLASVGLEPFCLELHSNKANKKNVLAQLEKTLSVGRVKPPEDYKETARKLQALRSDLNSVINELHQRRSYGLSLYDVITRYEENKKYKGKLNFSTQQVEVMQPGYYSEWRSILERLRVAALNCKSEVYNHPLALFESRDYSINHRDELSVYLTKVDASLVELDSAYAKVCQLLSLQSQKGFSSLAAMSELCELIEQIPFLPKTLITNTQLQALDGDIQGVLSVVGRRRLLRDKLLGIFDKSVFAYDAQTAALRFRQVSQSWFLPKMLGQNTLLKELRLYSLQPKSLSNQMLPAIYQDLIEFQELTQTIEKCKPTISAQFELLWGGVDSDDIKLFNVYLTSLKIQSLISRIVSVPKEILTALETIADASAMLPDFMKGPGSLLIQYKGLYQSAVLGINELHDKFAFNIEKIKVQEDWIDCIRHQIKASMLHLDELRSWSAFLRCCDEAEQNYLSNITQALKEGRISPDDLIPAFDCNMSLACAYYTISKTQTISEFGGAQFEERIRQYQNLAKEFELLSINELIARLSASIPSSSIEYAGSSEISLLQRAIKSGGRMMSIRKLFDSIPTLLRKVCPCMLMSPISVAQYIDPAFPKFDLVIFDEASQIPTCEAVGAIARGENAVVVGDPKQLPPTSFFAGNRLDEDNMDKEDLESLLDDCLALAMPQEYLLWHYRSKHESLIAYSNMRYYDNKLYTFPSPNDKVSEVRLVPVEGFYDRGNTKQNQAEAEAIVAEVVRRLKDPVLREESIGIVTFSTVQQNLIDDLLMEAFHQEPELETWNERCSEPVFIKNLESVQGDERDVILFSVGYGPDKDGKVTMNFGPLNYNGGWRRLNVAVTRARKSMLVFSTLKPEQIDLKRTNSDGLAGLKGFLEFAEGGTETIAINSKLSKQLKSGIEQQIAHQIRYLGYDVKCSIGCSKYKIDIGVVDPKQPDQYLLGILCDSQGQELTLTARDRYILQPGMLVSLGWRIHRIWTMDWLDNPDQEIEKIKQWINEALEFETLQDVTDPIIQATSSVSPDSFVKLENEEIANLGSTIYEMVEPKLLGPSDAFYMQETLPQIKNLINIVIEKEAPISRGLLCKRVLDAWGISRAGSKVDSIISFVLQQMRANTSYSNGALFYWKTSQNPHEYQEYRVPAEGQPKRSMDDISAEEIAAAIRQIMQCQYSLSKEDLIRETAKLFGFSRNGSVIISSVENGISEASKRGYIVISNEGNKISISA